MILIENYSKNQKNEWQSLVQCEYCGIQRVIRKYSRSGQKYCFECGRKIHYDIQIKIKINQIKEKHNVKLLSDIPKETWEKVKWQCQKGHLFETSIKNWLDNKGCLVCNGKINKTINDYKEIAIDRQCEFIGPFPLKTRFPTWWKCQCGNNKYCSYGDLKALKNRLKCDKCRKNELVQNEEENRKWRQEITKKIKSITPEISWAKLKISIPLEDLKEIKGIIYLYTNKINNKVLVGQSLGTFLNRYKGIPDGWVKYASGDRFCNALIKYGIENFDILLLEKNIKTRLELNKLETEYIIKYKSNNEKFGYNMIEGGKLNGYTIDGLQKIYKKSLIRRENFIEKARLIYNQYDYSNIIYKGSQKVVENILCKKCGLPFSQTAEQHLKAFSCPCPICRKINGTARRHSFQDFLIKAQNKHGESFEYDVSSYSHSHENINIFCNTCCKWFEQVAKTHIRGTTYCPNCKNNSLGKTTCNIK